MSTYPPKNCGIATFTAALLDRLRDHPDLPRICEIGVIAIADQIDELIYKDPIVHYDLRIDSVSGATTLTLPLPTLCIECNHMDDIIRFNGDCLQQSPG